MDSQNGGCPPTESQRWRRLHPGGYRELGVNIKKEESPRKYCATVRELSANCKNLVYLEMQGGDLNNRSAAAAPSPVLGNIPPGDGMPVGPVPPGFFQPFMSPRYPGGPRPPLRIPNQALGGVPGSQPLLPSGMDPTRQQGHPNMGGPMQRMTPPRGMVPLGPQNYGGAMRPPLNALGGPGMPGMNMGPGGGRPWPNPTNANSIPYSSASPGNYVGPPGGGGPPGTPIMPSPADSTNSGDNMYTLMNAVPPGPNRPNFPMGPGSDGPMGGLGGMESHHMNGSLGSGDMDSISKNSPNNMSLSNQPGTPRDDGEMGGNFLNPFQSESYSPSMTMSV
ncbi:PREDICTED: single-stranded DNA-binding protein 2 [Propithecus coquereli]|uniref:single-stranded DNA-binding protein 2 n=1 Tax=Propithecus coquereli TaxID=379532 RepID=UPI00063F905B|nr:PREDICTED: single-stranded DNA-binding protein 2 [Propithecus coquereli]